MERVVVKSDPNCHGHSNILTLLLADSGVPDRGLTGTIPLADKLAHRYMLG